MPAGLFFLRNFRKQEGKLMKHVEAWAGKSGERRPRGRRFGLAGQPAAGRMRENAPESVMTKGGFPHGGAGIRVLDAARG